MNSHCIVNFRTEPAKAKLIEKTARKHGLSTSDLLRMIIFSSQGIERVDKLLAEIEEDSTESKEAR